MTRFRTFCIIAIIVTVALVSLTAELVCRRRGRSSLGWGYTGCKEPAALTGPLDLINLLYKRAGWLISSILYGLLLLLEDDGSGKGLLKPGIAWIGANLYWWILHASILWLARHIRSCQDDGGGGSSSGDCPMGQVWVPFDISGHVFLAVLACGLLADRLLRLSTAAGWERRSLEGSSSSSSKRILIRIFYGAVVGTTPIVLVAWVLLLLRTCVYYHQAFEKIVGAILGSIYPWLIGSFLT